MRFKITLGILLIVLVARLFFLQILKHSYFRTLSLKNKVKIVVKPAPRGRIFDREGDVVADIISGYSAFFTKSSLPQKEINIISSVLKIPGSEIKKKIPKSRTILKRKLNFQELSQLSEIIDELPDVRIIEFPVRYYPFGKLFAHLIGYTGEIREKDLKSLKIKGYQIGDEIGKMGIEKYYEDYLRGTKGVEYIEVNAKGYEIGTYKDKSPIFPEKGNDVYFTVSLPLQIYTDSLLHNYKKGAVVAMDPTSGEILAYISLPEFQPNQLATRMDFGLWQNLQNDSTAPLFDRVLKGTYPPGSIFKIITAAVGIEDKVVDKYSRFIACAGKLLIGNRVFNCWKSHGNLDLVDAIIQSCDIYFYQLAMKIGITKLSAGAKSLGLGSPIGIDLDNEAKGFIPDSNWLNEKYGSRGWSKGSIANLGIGQGEILLTPLQVVTLFSAIVNNGKTFSPHILKKIVNNKGDIIKRGIGKEIHLTLSKNTISILKSAMRSVVQDSLGTAHFSNISGIGIGGKTGTSQNPSGEDHSLFVGFAPVDHPKIVAFAVLENAGHGASHAAPVVTKLIKYYLTKDDTTHIHKED